MQEEYEQPRDRAGVRRLQKKLNRERPRGTAKYQVKDLLAQQPNNDPFWSGTRKQLRLAEWFRKVWEEIGGTQGFHLRRMHYVIVSRDIKKLSRKRYENTKADWNELCAASKSARHLGLVDSALFVDRYNPEAITPGWTSEEVVAQPCVLPPELPQFTLPSIFTYGGTQQFERRPYVSGYQANERLDRSHYLSLWIEKTTMNDVLVPLCEELGIELVTAGGQQSITSTTQMLLRAEKVGKPCRVFYISDFDPGGDNMPVAVARRLEYYRLMLGLNVEVKLQPIALTAEQVRDYELPRNMLKDSDKSKSRFEARYGAGGAELDALEALHPGELEKLVRSAVAPYEDDGLAARLRDAEAEANELVEDEWQEATESLQERLAQVRKRTEQTAKKYLARAARLQKEMERALKPCRKQLDKLSQQFEQVIRDFDVELEERPLPEVERDEEEQDWLFDSGRDYLEQLRHYHKRKTGSDTLLGTGAVPKHSAALEAAYKKLQEYDGELE
jgi:vacuolar-type H+-ATPase subunit H